MERKSESRQSQYRTVRNARKTAQDWEQAALVAMAKGGVDTLAIPALAASLGVTKGSFYWHFDSLEQLIGAALKRWQDSERRALDEIAQIKDPARRLKTAFEEAMKLDLVQSLIVTLTASNDPAIVAVLRQVARRRIAYLTKAYEELGLSREEARALSRFAFTAYLGAIHLRRHAIEGLGTKRELEKYLEHAQRMLIPE